MRADRDEQISPCNKESFFLFLRMAHQSCIVRYRIGMNTIIGDPAKLGRDCEIHQHNRLIYSIIFCYIRMIVSVGIIQILMFYNVISFSHQLPDVTTTKPLYHQLE